MKQKQKNIKVPEVCTREDYPKDIQPHSSEIEQVFRRCLKDHGIPDETVQKILEELPEDMLVKKAIYKHVEFHGPLPYPTLLQEYEKIIPGMAKEHWNEILKEGQTDRWCKKAAVYSLVLGQLIGGSLGFCGLGIGYKLLMNGSTVGGISAIFSGLGVIVTSICGKYFIPKDK